MTIISLLGAVASIVVLLLRYYPEWKKQSEKKKGINQNEDFKEKVALGDSNTVSRELSWLFDEKNNRNSR